MKRKPVVDIPVDQLNDWPTRRLLGRLQSLMSLEESPEFSDKTEAEVTAWRSLGIGFKCDKGWSEAYVDLKITFQHERM